MLSICFHSDGERDVSVDEAGINGLLKMQRSTSVLSLASLHDGSSSNNLHALDLASSGMGYPHSTHPHSTYPLNTSSNLVSTMHVPVPICTHECNSTIK